MMNVHCRCPHAPFSRTVFEEARALLGRRAFLAGLAAAGTAMLVPWRARAASVLVLKAARCFDGVAMREPGLLVINGDRIVSMREGDAADGATVIDLGDATIMPGLIDCHTHIADLVLPSHYMTLMFPKYRTADNVPEATIYSVRNAQAILRNGFTTVRDVGGGAGIDLAVRDAIADGAIIGPRVFAAGQALSITGGHGDSNDVPGWVEEDPSVRGGAISYGPYGFRELVRQNVKLHVDHIKILATGGVLSYGDVWDIPQFNLDEVQAVVEESTKFRRKVAAHAHGDDGIAIAVEGGVHSVEHGTGVGEKTLGNMQQRRDAPRSDDLGAGLDLAAGQSESHPGDVAAEGRICRAAPRRRDASRRGDEREDRVRHGRRRLPARSEQQGLRADGTLGHAPDRRPALRHVQRGGAHRRRRSRRPSPG
jgi:imidazolonepropionase-like amidohydrolase